MSWPESFFTEKSKRKPEGTDRRANLSATGKHLSIFGSMVHIPRRPRGFGQAKPSHSLSYPRVQSHQGYALRNVKSEGAGTVRKKLEVRKSTGQVAAAPQQNANINERNVIVDDSSDDSGGEDEFIVTIDSPSRLSFRQAS